MKSEFEIREVLRFLLEVRNRLSSARASAILASEQVSRRDWQKSRAEMLGVSAEVSGAVRALDSWADTLESEILARQEQQKGAN
jgi:hypothetical protein